MSISAQLIIKDEVEMIGQCLEHLDSFKYLDEICITDSGSTDGTHEIICEFLKKTKKRVIYTNHVFENFQKQRNFSDTQTSCDWILRVDADETFSQSLDEAMRDIEVHSKDAIGISMNTATMTGDYFHRCPEIGRSLSFWRRGKVRFVETNPFKQVDNNGNEIHSYMGGVPCITDMKYNAIRKHHYTLKSDKALLGKFDKYKSTGLLDDPNFEEYGKTPEFYVLAKNEAKIKPSVELEKEWYDNVTNRDCPKRD